MGITEEQIKRMVSRSRMHILLLPLFFIFLIACIQFTAVHAYGEDIGTITIDGSTTTYSDLESLSDALDDLDGEQKHIVVDMLTNWDARNGHSEFDKRLIIPKDNHVT